MEDGGANFFVVGTGIVVVRSAERRTRVDPQLVAGTSGTPRRFGFWRGLRERQFLAALDSRAGTPRSTAGSVGSGELAVPAHRSQSEAATISWT